MVAYFCHHLSENYVDFSDLNVDLSAINDVLSAHYVDLSEKISSKIVSKYVYFNFMIMLSTCKFNIW